MTRISLVIATALFGSGCVGTRPDGHAWGADATLTPGWDRVGRAVCGALLEPGTWAPAAGAVVFGIDHFDRKVSNWAARKKPIFGTYSAADHAGDTLYGVEAAAFVVSFVATPSGETIEDASVAKLRALAVEGGALLVTEGAVSGTKQLSNRKRPNGEGHHSFPSGHATNAFALATLTARNLDSIDLPSTTRSGLQVASYALASATAWSRVEARKHYPSDVLAGAAIGHFLTAFIHDAFLGLPDDAPLTIGVEPQARGASIEIGFRF